MELEDLAVIIPHVLHQDHVHDVLLQGLQLEIGPAVVVGQNGDPVLGLGCVGVGCVVHQNHVAEVSVDHSQILGVHALRCLVAVLAEESVLDVLVVGIEVVEDHVGIAGVAGSEDNHLKVFAQVFENILSVGTDVDTCLYNFSSWEGNRQLDIVGRGQGVVAVDESLVQIKNHSFFT